MAKTYVIDFETYYDREYSLSKMSIEDYVSDPRFEVILVSVKVGDAPAIWCSADDIDTYQWLRQFDFPNCALVAHNAMFDALILQHHYGIRPGVVCDTMNMAQAVIRPYTTGVSLAKCLAYTGLGVKGTVVHDMVGRTRKSLSRKELEAYAKYCVNDTEGTYSLFQYLRPFIPKDEFAIIDMTHRMYLDPVLRLDQGLLAEILHEEREANRLALESVASRAVKSDLMSNDKFATILQSVGVNPPRKVSPATGKLTWAFAKTDPEWRAMVEEYADDVLVSALLSARTGIRSTIVETRTQRLLDIAKRYGRLRVPLVYYSAHTGRYGGGQKINLQNPPRVAKSRLRYAICAPKGHVFMAADLASIEARIVAWMAGQTNLVEQFANNEDVYANFATTAYRQETVKDRSKEDNHRRFVGKTCILGLGYGMGPDKLKVTLGQAAIKIALTEAQRLTHTYRHEYHHIPALWNRLNQAISVMATDGRVKLGPVTLTRGQAELPNGMSMAYHNICSVEGEWVYTYGAETRRLWGGKLLENLVQALARIIVMENALTIKRELGLSLVMQVHDELNYVVLDSEAKQYADAIKKIMSVPPSWATGLPVAVEVNYGATFGDCK